MNSPNGVKRFPDAPLVEVCMFSTFHTSVNESNPLLLTGMNGTCRNFPVTYGTGAVAEGEPVGEPAASAEPPAVVVGSHIPSNPTPDTNNSALFTVRCSPSYTDCH